MIFPSRILKLLSNQWNWQRERKEELDHLIDYESFFFKSSFEETVKVALGKVQLITSSTDVLHSVGIPELGVKIDSSPGRLNRRVVEFKKPGVFWGSCYELCGRGHRSIPFRFYSFFD